ncbi:hypothetical protein ACELLULO517_05435 [Acidisoma cellulosilytica]|uniref:Uncharacterized protein n=1 Tax=Acidisoma cellulosilyticum TaxID=2802395 RepID=A0A963YYU2_9PROT|nr:hypothetical protein [Acidisoma cellulosilyticum]MCB8879667.1 hypothetical protein [Acidisoma cellulosilyticum]
MIGMLQQLLRIGVLSAFNPARIVEDATSAARRMVILIACAAFAGFILLPAVGCAAAGVWILVQHHLGPVWAAFITAAGLALIAIIVLVIGLVASRGGRRDGGRAARPRPSGAAERAGSGPSVMDMAAAALPGVIALMEMPKKAASKAASAGAAAGRGVFSRHKGAFLLGAAVVGLVMGQDLFRGRARRDRDRSK